MKLSVLSPTRGEDQCVDSDVFVLLFFFSFFQVCKWYNLVVFTASVQEYADPVIDWLESERKFFSARYYRQHCTFRHGAFIKDLSSVEPDLSKVMILDNSPLSYMFHQGKADSVGVVSLSPCLCPRTRVPLLTCCTASQQITPSQYKAGSTTRRTTTSCTSSLCSRACSMFPTSELFLHCEAERTGSTWHDMNWRL